MRSVVVLLLIMSWGYADASAVSLTARARGVCEGTEHQITVTGTATVDVFPNLVGVSLVRQSVGICESEEIIPDNPVPLEIVSAGPYLIEFSASIAVAAPQSSVNYRYIPRFIHADGLDVTVSSGCAGNGFVSALVGCEEIPLQRGELVFVGLVDGELTYEISACEEDCWTESVYNQWNAADLEGLLGSDWVTYVGQIVDVFGNRVNCAMIGGDMHDVTRIEVAPGGNCGPVPVRETSWGSVKGLFR